MFFSSRLFCFGNGQELLWAPGSGITPGVAHSHWDAGDPAEVGEAKDLPYPSGPYPGSFQQSEISFNLNKSPGYIVNILSPSQIFRNRAKELTEGLIFVH